MLDQITNLIQEAAGSVVNRHPGVPDEKKEAVTNEAVNSLSDTFQQLSSGGDLTKMMGIFSGDAASKDGIMNQFSGNFVESITSKFGINAETAQSLAISILPVIAEKLKGLFGGGGFDFGSLLGGLQGGGKGDKDKGGGGFDLGDAMDMLKGGK
jgi:uncharacterized protein YidB (DUF937 family)